MVTYLPNPSPKPLKQLMMTLWYNVYATHVRNRVKACELCEIWLTVNRDAKRDNMEHLLFEFPVLIHHHIYVSHDTHCAGYQTWTSCLARTLADDLCPLFPAGCDITG